MSEFEFEELIADMFGVTDEEIESNPTILDEKVIGEFGVSIEEVFMITQRLLDHVPIIQTELTETKYRAFLSKNQPVMLMRKEVKDNDSE